MLFVGNLKVATTCAHNCPTCSVAELLWCSLYERPNDSQAPQHSLRIIALAQQRCRIPQLQWAPLLLKLCTAWVSAWIPTHH